MQIVKKKKTASFLELAINNYLAQDIVPTLGFGVFLVATSDNVVTTLCFRRRYYYQKLTLLQRVFEVDFPIWY